LGGQGCGIDRAAERQEHVEARLRSAADEIGAKGDRVLPATFQLDVGGVIDIQDSPPGELFPR
jgi:hypothetical protein